jgi:Ca-activated chloride channel family protein
VLTFAHAWLALALLLPLAASTLPAHRRVRTALEVPFLDRLARVSGQEPGPGSSVARRGALARIALLLVWLLIVAALMRPQWLEPPLSRSVPTRDLLLAVDLSGSMETEDFEGPDGGRVSRLAAAQDVLADFLARREGDRVGLIVFGSAPFVQAPFTEDLELVEELLGELVVPMAGPRTMLGDAIGLAVNAFERSEVERRVLILLTDGNDTGSRVPPVEAARLAADRGITVHVIAMGDPAAVGEEAMDVATLREVTATAGGRTFQAADREELAAIYDELDRLETREVETVTHRPRRDLYHWPLAGALVLSLAFLGWRSARP